MEASIFQSEIDRRGWAAILHDIERLANAEVRLLELDGHKKLAAQAKSMAAMLSYACQHAQWLADLTRAEVPR